MESARHSKFEHAVGSIARVASESHDLPARNEYPVMRGLHQQLSMTGFTVQHNWVARSRDHQRAGPRPRYFKRVRMEQA